MIQVENVSKCYGKHLALDNVSFTVNKGEILGFLGPNGAGKTTIMNIISGFISMTKGTVRIDKQDILEYPEEIKSKIGYLPENPPLYLNMTVLEYLNFVCKIKNVKKEKRKENMDKAMELVQITDVRKRLIKNLSKGYKQRVGLAQALIANPHIMILDEPTVGLDPKQIIEIRNLIKDLGKNHTIILSSHILPEVSAVCERIVIINKGRIVASDKPENLSARLGGGNNLMIRVPGDKQKPKEILENVPGVNKIDIIGIREPGTIDIIVEADKNLDIREKVFFALSRAELAILMMKPMDLTLEEIFLKVTTAEREGVADVSSVS